MAGAGSFIQPDNIWALWAILIGIAAGSIALEQKYQWAAKLTGPVLALVVMMFLSNIGITPIESPVYDDVWGYVVPMAIPLLLFQCNIKKIGRESGRLLILFLLSSFGTFAGIFIGFYLLRQFMPDLGIVSTMFAGTYVGGSVNFAAMADSFGASGELASAAVVADNLLMALYFFVLMAIPAIRFFRKKFSHPLLDQVEAGQNNGISSYWQPKEISLKDIAFDVAAAVIIVAISTAIADLFTAIISTGNIFGSILNSLLGNKYLVMTTLTMGCATAAPHLFGTAPGANEIGTFLIYIFFTVIGAPASIAKLLTESPLLLVYALIVVAFNMIFSFVLGKLFHFNLEEIILASNANIGGPTTATAMAISQGWSQLVGPIMLVGTLGYVLGNYYGILAGFFLLH